MTNDGPPITVAVDRSEWYPFYLLRDPSAKQRGAADRVVSLPADLVQRYNAAEKAIQAAHRELVAALPADDDD